MFANAIFITTLIFMSFGIVILQECQFLIPYRHVLFVTYSDTLLAFTVALFFNVFAVVYTLCRLFLLKDTGRKLAHLEKQLRTGSSLSEELHDRLSEDA